MSPIESSAWTPASQRKVLFFKVRKPIDMNVVGIFYGNVVGVEGIVGIVSRLSSSLPGPPRCYQAVLQALTTPFLPYHKTTSWNKSFLP